MTTPAPPWKIDNQADRIEIMKQIKDARICEAEQAARMCEEHLANCNPGCGAVLPEE